MSAEEPEPKGSAEWYGWFLSEEQSDRRKAEEEAKARKITERDAAPISYGDLRKALQRAIRAVEIDSDTDDRITLAAIGAVERALRTVMEELGMDEFDMDPWG